MESRLKDITAIVNHKGGVAKTSTTLSLAGGLMRKFKGVRVLCIDIDPQCNLSMLCGWDISQQELPTVYDSLCEDSKGLPVYKSDRGIYYTPASRQLQHVERKLHDQAIPQGVLWDRLFSLNLDDHTTDGLTDITESFDYVLIDCPPSLSDTTCNAIVVATRVLIPVQLEPLSINGLSPILVKQAELDRKLRKLLMGTSYQDQEIQIVPVMIDGNTKIGRGYQDYLQESYGDFLCNHRIRKDVKMREAQALYKDIFEYSPYSRAAIDYEGLVSELY